jgi:prolyl 4-hydroxylase
MRDRVNEIAQSDRHDAAGEHEAAINALARATKRGDIEAMTRLGKRLLIGDRAPRMPREGAGLLIDATKAGGGEAACRLAALAALGVQVDQSWDHSLTLLRVAAERGWPLAQAQIDVLRDVDLKSWFGSPAGVTRHEAPLVRTFEDLLPDSMCAWIIDQSRGRLVRAKVYDAADGHDVVHETRSNTAANFNLNEVEVVQLLLQARMAAACGVPMRNMEAPAVLHYEVGEQITDHYDFVNPASPHYAEEVAAKGQRAITFLAYLNADYEGGETDFPRLGLRHKGKRGEGIFFVNSLPGNQPDLRMLHAGKPPTRGEKWIVSQFIRSRAFTI